MYVKYNVLHIIEVIVCPVCGYFVHSRCFEFVLDIVLMYKPPLLTLEKSILVPCTSHVVLRTILKFSTFSLVLSNNLKLNRYRHFLSEIMKLNICLFKCIHKFYEIGIFLIFVFTKPLTIPKTVKTKNCNNLQCKFNITLYFKYLPSQGKTHCLCTQGNGHQHSNHCITFGILFIFNKSSK